MLSAEAYFFSSSGALSASAGAASLDSVVSTAASLLQPQSLLLLSQPESQLLSQQPP
jgi:hypothetical protein